MSIPLTKLTSGLSIPGIGFGLWQNKDRQECVNSVKEAIKAGYRHFDTAQLYGNEAYLGQALKETGLARGDTFITTKIWIPNFLRVEKSFEKSLENLQTDYVDLLLLHFPVTGLRSGAWEKLEKLYSEGKAKSIGVSNYTIKHLDKLLKDCNVKPAVNQVELHVFLQQPELVEYCQARDIVIEAYSPLAHGKGIDDPLLAEIAKKHNKTPVQIMLRWLIEKDMVPLPKSVTPARIKQNIDVFNFELDQKDMKKLATLNKNMRTLFDPSLIP